MNSDAILALPGMPPAAPSYARGPYRFHNREYLIIRYRSDPAAIRRALPEPLQPDGSDTVLYEFIRMPDSESGFGDYTESGVVIPATLEGKDVNYTAQMYLDAEPPTTGGREIWGFPKKIGQPRLRAAGDTLTGTLDYAGERVALGTMVYKQRNELHDWQTGKDKDSTPFIEKLQKTQINLKLLPDEKGGIKSAELIAYQMTDITLKGFWTGNARLHLVPHVNAPVADLPVLEILGGTHVLGDLTLPYGDVVHRYR